MVNIVPSSLKTCTRCHKQKPRSDFDEDGRRRDDLRPYCRACGEKGIIVPPWMKECSRCGKILPPQDFFGTSKSKDGLSYFCKKCDKKDRPAHPREPRSEKKCNRCQETKPISEFGKDQYCADRLRGHCKQCEVAYHRKNIPEGSRVCSMCKVDKPFRDFHRDNATDTGFRSSCIKCESIIRDGEQRRSYVLKKLYGITSQEYDDLLKSQNGVCAICKQPNNITRYGKILALHVDHCHRTGKVRGLLCSRCNTALGYMKEDPEIIQSLLNYVNEHILC